ncbi:MAG: cytosine permease [Dongiaceae bacterium]
MSDLLSLLNEDNPLQPTLAKSKQGWLWVASVLIGCTICVPVFFMGAQMGAQQAFWPFVAACFLGGILATAIAIATGIIGQRTGLPTAMLAKIAFGHRGYILANAAMVLGAIGWFGIQTAIFSGAFLKLSMQVWGIEFARVPVILVAGLLMSSTAVIGFRGLGRLSYIATPLLIVLLILPLYVFARDGLLAGVSAHVPAAPLAFGTMVAMVAGAYSFASTMPDVTRFMRNSKETVKGLIANFTLAYPVLLIVTGALAIAGNESDFMQIMLNLGFGSLAIVVLFLATWTTNDTNVYSAAVSGNVFLPQFQRWQLAVGAGVLGTFAAIFGIFEHFMEWLIFSGNLYAPMAGVYVADYFLNRQRYEKLGDVPAFHVKQLAAWGIGLAVGLSTTDKSNMGLELFRLTTVPMLDALLTAALALFLLTRPSRR